MAKLPPFVRHTLEWAGHIHTAIWIAESIGGGALAAVIFATAQKFFRSQVDWTVILVGFGVSSFLIYASKWLQRYAVAASAGSSTGQSPAATERIILDLKPGDLTDLYKLHTSAQADALATIYVGKWMSVSGTLGDAQKFDFFMQVTFEDSQKTYGFFALYMYFKRPWFERLSVLKRGSTITVLGKVQSIGSAELHLKDCELT